MKFPSRLITKSAVVGAVVAAGAGTAFASTAAAAGPAHGITTIAGNGTAGFSGDGHVAVNAELNVPSGVGEDVSGSLYIGDSANNRIRKVVNPTSLNNDIISTFAGTGTAGFSGDGGLATAATLRAPTGVDVNSSGNVFVVDTGNGRVRMVAGTTGTFFKQSMIAGHIYTVAGNGASCTGKNAAGPMKNGVMATSGALCAPTGIAVDGHGDFFVADTGHNEVFMVTPSGAISPYAGTGSCGFSGDGGKGTNAKLCVLNGLALDSSQDLFISDTGNTVVREVTENGNIKTFAGMAGKLGSSGDGGKATSAKLAGPTGVTLDPSGNVYISDTLNSKIRKVDGTGTITTYAGTGVPGFSGDGGEATSARIFIPTGSGAMDGTALYFVDTGNQRIRGVFNGPPPVLPESTWTILLPLSALVLLGGGLFIVGRRHRRREAAAAAI